MGVFLICLLRTGCLCLNSSFWAIITYSPLVTAVFKLEFKAHCVWTLGRQSIACLLCAHLSSHKRTEFDEFLLMFRNQLLELKVCMNCSHVTACSLFACITVVSQYSKKIVDLISYSEAWHHAIMQECLCVFARCNHIHIVECENSINKGIPLLMDV